MLRFKTERVEREFKLIDPRLRFLLYAVAGFVELEFGKDFWLTHLRRTQKEQDGFYAKNPKYKKKPWKSVHQFGCGGDGRSLNFADWEIKKIDDFLDQYVCYNSDDGSKQTSVVHNVGFGDHLHVQVKPYREYTFLRRVLVSKN